MTDRLPGERDQGGSRPGTVAAFAGLTFREQLAPAAYITPGGAVHPPEVQPGNFASGAWGPVGAERRRGW